MRFSVAFLRSRYLTRVAGASLLAGLAAGCSADTGRFSSQDPFANPFGGQRQQASNDIADGYPAAPVRTQSIAPMRHSRSIAAQPLPPVGSVRSVPSAHSPRYDMAEAAPAPMPRAARPVAATGSLPASPRIASPAIASGRGSWSAEGGTEVTASAGDSVLTLSNRYGVPANAIMSTNGLTASALQPGQRVIIPVFSVAEAQAPAAPAVAEPPPVLATAHPVRTTAVRAPALAEAKPERLPERMPERAEARAEQTGTLPSVPVQAGGTHVVKPGETLTAIALSYGTTRPRLAKLNAIDEWTSVRIGQKLKVPAGAAVAEREEPEAKPVHKAAEVAAAPAKAVAAIKAPTKAVEARAVETKAVETKPVRLAAAEAASPAKPPKGKPMPVLADEEASQDDTAAVPAKPVKATPVKAAAKADKPVQVASLDPQPVKPAAPAPAKPEPVKADTGPLAQPAERNAPEFRWPVKGRVIQAFGSGSDGINIAVPEGTDVRAAENGVVAYAGSELKGYGNLVLIKHADGYVTAYAHAKDLNVKRGDTVRRGQVIATAGQTGNVTAPQLLFELRKGATPIDPRQYLSGT